MSTAPHHDDNHADDEMLSIEEAAEFLRVPVATLRYWRHLGIGPRSFRVGRHVRYWHTEVQSAGSRNRAVIHRASAEIVADRRCRGG